MPECVVCGTGSSVTASCPHCATAVCAEHRRPASHGCPGVDADHTDGWVIDLDGSGDGGDPERDEPARWRERLRPSRSGAWLAAGTLVVLVVAVAAVTVLGPQTGASTGAVVASTDGDGGPTGGDGGAGRLDETRVERLVAERTNEERRVRGLEPLSYDRTLARVGESHSGDMRERGFVGHENPDGEGLRARYAAAGVDCPGGENVYHSPNGGLARSPRALADHVVGAWIDSDGHRETLLKDRFGRQGVGVVLGPEGGVWVTQNFC
jgi:uncharacterized protein YkwD